MTEALPSHRNLGPLPAATPRSVERFAPRRSPGGEEYHNFAGIRPDRRPLTLTLNEKLAKVLGATLVQSARPDSLNDNSGGARGLPAGYTYLFQLAAHDLANTHITLSGSLSGCGPVNLRRRPLTLQTVLGEGARGCPYAYQVRNGSLELRTGQVRTARPEGGWDFSEPARDLPRVGHQTGASGAGKGLLDIVLIPDARNDDNMILAQMTVLFHGIANHVLETIEADPPPGGDVETVAQAVLTQLWRRILREDLLARILHPEIHRHYAGALPLRLDGAAVAQRPSIEFAFAAARMGHALVRDTYQLNARVNQPLGRIIEVSSSHKPAHLPLPRDYLIDWGLFFPLASEGVPAGFNWAFRFGAHAAVGLQVASAATSTGIGGKTVNGLLFRDLTREASGRLASVHQIVEKVQAFWPGQGWGNTLDPIITCMRQRRLVARGLARAEAEAARLGHVAPLTRDERRAILRDPPLSLFLQFEAEQLGNGGRTLGPLGSILVAEGMWPAFVRLPSKLASENEEIERRAFGLVPTTMPQLLQALQRRAPDLFKP